MTNLSVEEVAYAYLKNLEDMDVKLKATQYLLKKIEASLPKTPEQLQDEEIIRQMAREALLKLQEKHRIEEEQLKIQKTHNSALKEAEEAIESENRINTYTKWILYTVIVFASFMLGYYWK